MRRKAAAPRAFPRRLEVWAEAQRQLQTLGAAQPGRCPHCGVPDSPECKDETGACRYCRDGEDTPF
jgi:hypothetical protein